MSFISAGNTTTTTLLINGDTTGNLVFNTGGANTTALTITNAQNVGIGTTNPGQTLSVSGALTPRISVTDTRNSVQTQLLSDNVAGYVGTITNHPINFVQNNTVRAVIDTAGNFGIGMTTPLGAISWNTSALSCNRTTNTTNFVSSGLNISSAEGVGNAQMTFGNSSTAINNWHFTTADNGGSYSIWNGNYGSGSIMMYVKNNGGIANFSGNNVNISDRRVKKNINDAGKYLDKICSIPVKTFEFIDDIKNDGATLGVIAQDVLEVAPEFINTKGFGKAPEGEAPYLSIYETDLKYAMLKAIQELNAKVEAQAAEIAALKAGA